MRIIQKQPNSSGAYPPIQSWNGETPPEGYYEITCDYAEFYNGFVELKIVNDVVVDFRCNERAWEEWKASLPPVVPPEKQIDEKVLDLQIENTTLKEQLLSQDIIISTILEDILPSMMA